MSAGVTAARTRVEVVADPDRAGRRAGCASWPNGSTVPSMAASRWETKWFIAETSPPTPVPGAPAGPAGGGRVARLGRGPFYESECQRLRRIATGRTLARGDRRGYNSRPLSPPRHPDRASHEDHQGHRRRRLHRGRRHLRPARRGREEVPRGAARRPVEPRPGPGDAAGRASSGASNYADPPRLVNDPAIDAVFVLTNLETHLEYTQAGAGGRQARPGREAGRGDGRPRSRQMKRRGGRPRASSACRGTTTSTRPA